MACPADSLGKLRSLWMEVQVHQQVTPVGHPSDQPIVIAAPNQRAILAMQPIEALQIAATEVAHRARQVARHRLELPVVVVGHQGKTVRVDAEALGKLAQNAKKHGARPVVEKDGLAAGTAVYDMVAGAGEVKSGEAHGRGDTANDGKGKEDVPDPDSNRLPRQGSVRRRRAVWQAHRP